MSLAKWEILGFIVSSAKPRNLKITWLQRLFLYVLEQLRFVRSEQSHLLTASLHLTATLFSLIRQSSAN